MDSNYKIYFGAVDSPFLTFDYNSIESVSFENAVDIIGDELSSDVMEFSLFFDDVNGTLRNTQYGTPVFLYNGDSLIGKYYFEKIERTAVKRYSVYTASLIGLVGREEYYGNFFSRASFEDALNHVLFSTGISQPIYSVYKANGLPVISGSSRLGSLGVKMTNDSARTDTYKQRLQTAFTLGTPIWKSGETSISDTVVGELSYHYYSIVVTANRADTSSPAYYTVSFYYNRVEKLKIGYDTPLIGAGTCLSFDINPTNGTAEANVDYVKYDDPTTTGIFKVSASISVPGSPSATSLDVAFSPVTVSNGVSAYYCQHNLIWDYYRVYNKDKTLRVDAGFATDGNNHYYIFNKVNGTYGSPQHFTTSGNAIGVVGDLTRGGRDCELSDSIEFGYGVASSLVNGWLPISTRREALHQLLFSQNVSLLKSADGKLLFTGITNGTPISIADEDIFDENKEENINEARQISVTEHSYTVPSSTAVVIFDNTDSAAITGDYVAIFNNSPIYGTITGSGITIKRYNCNAAVVSGRGTISGTPYVYSKHETKYQNVGIYDGADVSVGSITLINAANSDNIMSKLKAYYCAGLKKIGIDVVYRGQRCGSQYTFRTLFAQSNTGHLSKISARASSFIKANCDFISGFVPPASGGYNNYKIVEHSTSWEIPDDVREREYANVRFILIGSGHDGTSGSNGENGSESQTGSGYKHGGAGGDGGAAGVGGEGGKVYQITVDVTNVASVAVTSSGYNTVVKTYDDNSTLLNTYNSSSGNTSDGGITNLFTGDIYARRGKDGRDGGGGGTGGYYDDTQTDPFVYATNGEDVTVPYRTNPFLGGNKDRLYWGEVNSAFVGGNYYRNYYGGGGGAADGNNGGSTYIVSTTSTRTLTSGGNGANAVVQSDVYTGYGSGGFGGNGGGGGGGAGVYITDMLPGIITSYSQNPGSGGTGSAGTSGIAGCLLVYY